MSSSEACNGSGGSVRLVRTFRQSFPILIMSRPLIKTIPAVCFTQGDIAKHHTVGK